MSRTAVLEKVESAQLKKEIPEFHVGDTVSVHIKIIEGNKERTQIFTGTVIARKGKGLSETFSIHRVAYGEGMERVFLLHSPRVVQIEVKKEGDVRRSKLYHLRGTSGKAARVKGRVVSRSKKEASEAVAPVATEEKAEAQTTETSETASDSAETQGEQPKTESSED